MVSSKLTEFQTTVLREFFARESAFFLTGGAALAGFHLGHRGTDDLALFTVSPEGFERARHVLADVGASLGAKLSVRQDAPGFRRTVLESEHGAVVVDAVLDRVPQLVDAKPSFDGITVDPAAETLVNELTAVVGRAEERDLVDLMFLERTGLRIEDHLGAALNKGRGCTPATLAWLLSEIALPEGVRLPAAVSAEELAHYVAQLATRLRRLAFPMTS